MKNVIIKLLLLSLFCGHLYPKAPPPISSPIFTSSQALTKLIEGNKRFYEEKSIHVVHSAHYRKKLADQQYPLACIVSCSDSRVPPEIIFDQRLGRLFVVRTAGNVVDSLGIASIEYAVKYLQVPLVIVLGHENCGAVKASLQNTSYPGHIPELIKKIKPAVIATDRLPGDHLHNASLENVKRMVASLSISKPIIIEAIKAGKLQIKGGFYKFEDGKVEIIG